MVTSDKLISKMQDLIIHHIMKYSRQNGPGIRTVIWTQGCSLGCKGCFNQLTHEPDNTNSINPDILAKKISRFHSDGLTISGGEPLDQAESLLKFIQTYKNLTNKTILLFTGYSIKEILSNNLKKNVLLNVDAALAGRYIKGKIWENKNLIQITNNIKSNEIIPESSIEIVLNENKINITGYPNRDFMGNYI